MPLNQSISSLNIPNSHQMNLKEKGLHLVHDLYKNHDISLAQCDELTRPPDTKTALEYLEEEKSSSKICTFIKNLDVILNDVLKTGLITELVGLPGSGRSLLCLHLSVSAQVTKNGVCGEVVYICTNMNFSISKLKEIAASYIRNCSIFKNSSIESILKKIHYVSIATIKEFQACVNYLEAFLEEHKNVTMVVVDSITFPLRQVDRTEKTTVMYSLMKQLSLLANIYKFTVVLTNDMTTVTGTSNTRVVPSLRDTFYHLVNSRIVISKENDSFHAELLKSSVRFPAKCDFDLRCFHVT